MSYPQPQVPYPGAYPSFDQQQQSAAAGGFGQAAPGGWPQMAPPVANANDFAYYSAPSSQSPPQAALPSQSPPMGQQGGWGQSNAGPRLRPMPSPGGGHTSGGGPSSMPPNGSVAFMPQQLMSNPMAGMALDYGKAHLAKNLSWVMSFLSALRYYFHVNNRYVVAKLRVLLLPFLHKEWRRERLDGGVGLNGSADDPSVMSGLVGSPVYRLPRDDVNAPDLYLPTMGFISFTLLMGYALGVGNQFHPEVLGLTASRTLVLLFFEVLALKGGLYLISVGPPVAPASLLDLVSYAAYKYVHCIVMIAVGLLLGPFCFYLSIVLLGLLAGLFMMRTMKRVCTPAAAAGAGGAEHSPAGGYTLGNQSFGQGKHRRNYFLLCVGGAQILLCWFLVRTASAAF